GPVDPIGKKRLGSESRHAAISVQGWVRVSSMGDHPSWLVGSEFRVRTGTDLVPNFTKTGRRKPFFQVLAPRTVPVVRDIRNAFLMFFSAVEVWGHRGWPARYPDNTVAGIRAAAAVAVGVEIDVRRSADGRLVLAHDPDVAGL